MAAPRKTWRRLIVELGGEGGARGRCLEFVIRLGKRLVGRLKSKFQSSMVQWISFLEFEKWIVEKPLSWQKQSQSTSGKFVAWKLKQKPTCSGPLGKYSVFLVLVCRLLLDGITGGFTTHFFWMHKSKEDYREWIQIHINISPVQATCIKPINISFL